ncbi:hypothetical protein [Pontibacillus salipaludis]|uniref:hypothetical protein n=1 Tax=Pontibacillus salipaludis TaxID=1697394 RepID=UPI0031EF366A
MPKIIKVMLFWTLVAPTIITILLMIIEYSVGKDVELLSYSAIFLGIAAGGLIFAGPLNYLIAKSKEK